MKAYLLLQGLKPTEQRMKGWNGSKICGNSLDTVSFKIKYTKKIWFIQFNFDKDAR